LPSADFAVGDLLSHLYTLANQEELMEESEEEVSKREEILKMYHSTKEALKIISTFPQVTLLTH